jgi:hypothetical protein
MYPDSVELRLPVRNLSKCGECRKEPSLAVFQCLDHPARVSEINSDSSRRNQNILFFFKSFIFDPRLIFFNPQNGKGALSRGQEPRGGRRVREEEPGKVPSKISTRNNATYQKQTAVINVIMPVISINHCQGAIFPGLI